MRFRHPTAGFASSAFTLIEVLVALSIFALMAVVLGSAYINVLNSYAAAARGREADEDSVFACQLLLQEPDIEKARQGDQFDTAEGRHVVWKATIDPTTTADLFTVTFECEVSALAQEEPRKLTRTFNLMRPTWSDPAERDKLLAEARDRIAEIQSKTANGFVAMDSNAGAGGGRGNVPVGVGNRGGRGANGGQGGGAGFGGGNRGNRGSTGPVRNDGTVPTRPPGTGNNNNGNRANPPRGTNPVLTPRE